MADSGGSIPPGDKGHKGSEGGERKANEAKETPKGADLPTTDLTSFGSRSTQDPPQHPEGMRINVVQTGNLGLRIRLQVAPDDTIEKVKKKITEKIGISPDKQRLLFNTYQFLDNDTLVQRYVTEGSTIHLVAMSQKDESSDAAGNDTTCRAVDSAVDSVPNAPEGKTRPKNKNASCAEDTEHKGPCSNLHSKRQGRYVGEWTKVYEEKGTSFAPEQKNMEYNAENLTKGKSNKNETKLDIKRDDRKAEVAGDKKEDVYRFQQGEDGNRNNMPATLEVGTNDEQDMGEVQRSEEVLAKQSKEQLTDGHQQQTSHTAIGLKKTGKHKNEVIQGKGLDGSFVIVNFPESEDVVKSEVDSGEGMANSSVGNSDIRNSMLRSKKESLNEKKKEKGKTVEEQSADSKSTTALKSSFMKNHQGNSKETVVNAAAAVAKVKESSGHDADEVDDDDSGVRAEDKKLQTPDSDTVPKVDGFPKPVKSAEMEHDTRLDDSADDENPKFKNSFSEGEDQTEEQPGEESQQSDVDTQAESDSALTRSSSIENIAEGEQEETDFDDEKQFSIGFEMKSLTQLQDNSSKELDSDKELGSQKRPDTHTDTVAANGNEKPNTYKEEKKVELERFDKEESPKSESPEECLASTKYTLQPVGKGYVLKSKNLKPVKVPQITGKSNVSVEGNFILIDDDAEYLISDESGEITVSKIGEAKSGDVNKYNQKLSTSPETSHAHDEKEIPLGGELKATKKKRATMPKMEETIKMQDDGKSQTDKCHEPVVSSYTDDSYKNLPTSAEDEKEELDAVTDLLAGIKLEDLVTGEPGQQQSNNLQPLTAPKSSNTDGGRQEGNPPKPAPRKPKENPVCFTRKLVELDKIVEGYPLKLECCVSKPDLKVKWFKDDTPIEGSERMKLVSSNMTHSLQIDHANLKDSGKYMVEVENKLSTSLIIIAEKPIMITLPLSGKLDARAGQQVTFECQVSKPDLEAEWTVHDQQVKNSGRFALLSTDMTHKLVVRNVDKQDEGRYVVRFGDRESSCFLHVYEKPSAPKNLAVGEVTSTSCQLLWQEPASNGGSNIRRYLVQMREAGLEEWMNADTSVSTHIVISKLDRKKQYLFQVAAENEDGPGEFSEIVGPVETKAVEKKPIMFTLPLSERLDARAGQKITFECQVSKPGLDAEWTVHDHPVKNSGRFELLSAGMTHKLVVRNVDVEDIGEYVVKIRESESRCYLQVYDKPSAPKNLTCCNVTSESCHLDWQKPDHENGSRITKYIVQMCEAGEKNWTEAGSSLTTDIVVNELQRSKQYLFRVAAENEFGTGRFAELSDPVTVEDISELERKTQALCREVTFIVKYGLPDHSERQQEVHKKMTHLRYMKWKFVTVDSRMLDEKMLSMKPTTRCTVHVSGDKTVIDLGHVDNTSQIETFIDNFVDFMLRNTANLIDRAVNFSLDIRGEEVEKALTDLAQVTNKAVYTEVDMEIPCIYMVCKNGAIDRIEQKIHEIINKLNSNSVEKLPVFGKKMEQQSFKEFWKEKYPLVEIEPKYTSANRLFVTLRGSKKEMEEAKVWIDGYPCNEISFKDVKHRDMFSNIVPVLKEFLTASMENEEDVWNINEKTQKIGICASTPDATGSVTEKVKKCIKKGIIPRKENHPKFNLQVVDILEKDVSEMHKPYIRVTLKDEDSVEVFGLENHMKSCFKDISERVHSIGKSLQRQVICPDKTCDGSKETEHSFENDTESVFVTINNPLVFDFISQSEQYSNMSSRAAVNITPLDGKSTKGFSLQGKKKELLDIKQDLKTLEKHAETWIIDFEIQTGEVSRFDEITHKIQRSSTILIQKEETKDADNTNTDVNDTGQRKVKWIFPHGHTVEVVHSCTSHDKKVSVSFIEETKKQKTLIETPDGNILLLVPEWQGGSAKEKTEVHDRFLGCLHRCISRDVHHVDVFIGHMKWKVQMFVKQLLVPLKSMLKKQFPSITICFCSKNQKISEDIYKSCKGAFKGDTSPEAVSSDCHKDQNSRYDGLKVNVVKGNLADTKADIIVNTISSDGDLRKGAISKSILSKAGQRLQEDIKKNFPLHLLNIYQTNAYSIKDCKYIFHVCLESFKDDGSSKKKLETVVFNCLQKTVACDGQSVAFPALGAGGQEYPLEEVMDAMFNAVEEFNESYKKVTCLKEVKFVLYDEETLQVFRREKRRRGMDPLSVTKHHYYRKISLNAEKGSITDVDKECVLYLWETTTIRKVFTQGKVEREIICTPACSKLNFKDIIHVPYEDNKKEKIDALVKGLKAVILNKKESVAIYFENAHPFLKDKDFMTQVSAAVSDTCPFAENVLDVTVVIGNPFYDKVETFFKENSQTASTVTECMETADNVVLTVVGMQNDMFDAVEKWRSVKGVSLMEVHYLQPDTIHTSEVPVAPGDMTMQRGDQENRPSPTDLKPSSKHQWKPEALQKVDELELYVEMQNIPAAETTDSLKVTLFGLKLPIVVPDLVYCDGSDVAIIICKSAEDAKRLSEYKSQFKFERLVNKTTLLNFSSHLDARVWNTAKAKHLLTEIKDKLNEMHVTVVNEKTLEIKTFTLYQIKCAQALLAKYDEQKERDSRERPTGQEGKGYVIYENKEVIKNVSEPIWEIVNEICKDDISLFENDFEKIKHESETLVIPVHSGEIAANVVKKLKLYTTDLKQKEVLDVPVDKKKVNITIIPKCCNEVEVAFGYACCIWNDRKEKLLAYDESYEKVLKVKHLLSLKCGMTKSTPRSRDKRSAVKTTEDIESVSGSMSTDTSDRREMHSYPEERCLNRDAKSAEKYMIGKITVYVYQGDILQLPVDCIVNAANKNLSHGGGVAAVIARAAGYDLVREGDAYIAKEGTIPVGQACATTAGKLNYGCVIHTVGPAWWDYRPHSTENVRRCETDLYHAIFSCFTVAEKRKMKTIAIPAVSSAIFGVPEEICVNQYARATIDYCRKVGNDPSVLTEIHFIDIKPKIVKKIQDAFNKTVGEGWTSQYGSSDFVASTTTKSIGPTSLQSHAGPGEMKLPEPLAYEDGWKRYTYCFLQTDTLTVCCSDIFSEKTSAIVVSVNKQGKGGAIGEAVFNRIPSVYKPSFMTKLKKEFGSSQRVGDAVVSDGYSCGYPSVILVVYPFDARRKPIRERKVDLMKAYSNVLHEANRNKNIRSVVTTMFGIESKEDTELMLAADAFLYSYLSYCKQKIHETSKLEVTIVCQTSHAYDVVCGVFDKYVQAQKEVEATSTSEEKSEPEDLQVVTDTEGGGEENCVICMDSINEPKKLKCGHIFCTECIEQHFKFKQQCPTCGRVCGKITGDQPEGSMQVNKNSAQHLPGYFRYGTIVITYNLPNGVQGEDHPNPGSPYKGIFRKAYLPDNEEGRKIADMLRVAFDRKLTFTIGSSRTTGQEGVITWNDIHHKTDPRPNTQFGYPDPTYLERVKEELAAKGVTEKDISA